jgi:hypothetical protein
MTTITAAATIPPMVKKSIRQINHWNSIMVVFHVTCFLSIATGRLTRLANGDSLCVALA